MTVRRGWYKHYTGTPYYVLGVGCAHHESNRRLVVYTSVKTEEIGTPGEPPYDFCLRSEAEFEEWVFQDSGNALKAADFPEDFVISEEAKKAGYFMVNHTLTGIVRRVVRRFRRVTDPGAKWAL